MNVIILSFVHGLQSCNLHFCFLAAFGGISLVAAAIARREGRHAEAYEKGVAGVIHILMGVF